MRNNAKQTVAYWQSCLQQQLLHELCLAEYIQHCQKISRAECINRKLQLSFGESMVVIPHYAKYKDHFFVPYILLADLNLPGQIIVPHAVLEGAPLQPLVLASAEDFANYMIIQPPDWAEDSIELSWSKQLAYADELLENVAYKGWRVDLQAAGYEMQDHALIMPLSALNQPSKMNIDLLQKSAKIEIIAAERNSGKSAHIKQLIILAWIEAALSNANPPQYVWLEYNKPVSYANIIDCVNFDRALIASIYNDLDILRQLLAEKYHAYLSGKQAIDNWRELNNNILDKYADKGGIYLRLGQLQNNLKDAKAQKRHLQVLYSIWERQIDLVVKWARVFDIIPFVKRYRLQRLYAFFKQNFPIEHVFGCNEKQLDAILTDKMRRAENSLRFIGDVLHQVENDFQQENVVREKCLQWCKSRDLEFTKKLEFSNMEDIEEEITGNLWQEVTHLAAQYWHLDFLLNPQHAESLSRRPGEIDLLLVEHAEYISPMQAAELLAISQRAIVIGSYAAICTPRFSVQIDYELTKHFSLAKDDIEFEDLQFSGVLGSLSSMWNLTADGKDADKQFIRYDNQKLQCSYIDTKAKSATNYGSKINTSAAEITIQWLCENKVADISVAIYTTFSAQLALLRKLLDMHGFKSSLHLIQQPCFKKSAISIFIPVYNADDPGPYSFDRGEEILQNLIANTEEQIIVIGDIRIFKPELHSPAGKFARMLKEEVECV